MKKILMALACMCFSILAKGQEEIINIDNIKSERSEALTNQASVVFLAYNNNLMITSSNASDVVKPTEKQADGQWSTEVICDLSAKGADPSRTFTILIKGTALQGEKKLSMRAGQRTYFQVAQAQHMINFLWIQTKDILYAVEGKACINFQIPSYINDLDVAYSDGIGAKRSRHSENGLNIISLEVDCKKLETLINNISSKQNEVESARKALDAQDKLLSNLYNNPDGVDDAKFDAEENKKEELKKKLDAAIEAVPELYIRLGGPTSNTKAVELEKLKELTQPKYKLTVNITDALHKETVYASAVAQLMANAEQLSRARKYNEAQKLYHEAANNAEATEAEKAAALASEELNIRLSEYKVAANSQIRAINNYKKSEGLVDYNEVEKCYKAAITNFTYLKDLTQDSYYQGMIDKLDDALNKLGQVIVGVCSQAGFHQGKTNEKPVTGINIYGVRFAPNAKSLEKDILGEKIGEVNENSSFHIQFPKGEYRAIQFAPNAQGKANGLKGIRYIYVEGDKHMKVKIRFKD